MKILWFTNTPSLYKKNPTGYNGGGWIESLEQIISNIEGIELAISFLHNDDCFKIKQNNATYYPIPLYNTTSKKIKHNILYKKQDINEVHYFMKVIEDFKPDVIHIFGTEQSFGKVIPLTKIPVIIHIQGILTPYKNAFFAPGSSKNDLLRSYTLRPLKLLKTLRSFSYFSHNAKREVEIFNYCKYFMGRTEWDKKISSLFSPNSQYFYCSEVLRAQFYAAKAWHSKKRTKLKLISTISKTEYKGFDLVLKTAKILTDFSDVEFEWDVFGIKEYYEWEKRLNIKCNNVNISLKGVAESEMLIANIQDSDIFIHPSYIDNSPNSVCEAQMIGIPVISTNVGGIESLIENNITGILVPANDPYILAQTILDLNKNEILANQVGSEARKLALRRHDVNQIRSTLLSIYYNLKNANTTN